MTIATRGAVTNAILLGQQLGAALGASRALIDRTLSKPADLVEELRRWYYNQHPSERDRLLWLRFVEAKVIHARLENVIEVAREALDIERHALAEAQAEREALASRPLPMTVEEEVSGTRPKAVRHYQAVSVECQQREAAIVELERLLPAPELTMSQLTEATTRVLEAVVTIEREAFVRRLRESDELEQLRSRFQRLRVEASAHGAEIDEWRRQTGRPVRTPRIAFLWPSPPAWQALLDSSPECPKLVWDDESRPLSVEL